MKATVIVCIGNPDRGDDGVGPALAQALRGVEHLRVLDARNAPENVLGQVERLSPARVIIVDACDFGAEPGEFRFLSEEELGVVDWPLPSTHSIPIPLLAQLIHRLYGCEVRILGVQPESVAFGSGLSPKVAAALPRLVQFLSKQRGG